MAFWKRKQQAEVPAAGGSAVAVSAAVAPGTTAKTEVASGERQGEQKLPPPVATGAQILTRKEIEQRISQLSEPGSTVFFYLSGSPASGGPLGQGAAVIELNPDYPGKKQKRYTLYVDSVDGLQPVGRRQKIMSSDKAAELAIWVKDRHHKRGATL